MNMHAAQLPEDPTTHFIGVVTHENSVTQKTHDATIPSAAGASRHLEGISNTASQSAATHNIAQVREETQATTSNAGAELALTASAHDAKNKSANLHDIAAQTHHIKANSDSATAHTTGAQAAALEDASRIQTIIAEVTQRQVTAQHEVEDRTNAGVKQEMRAANAVQEETGRKALDLEAQLAANAGVSAPKV